MSRTPFLLAWRNLRAHWLRSGLTAAAMTIALFLFCVLISLVTSIQRSVADSSSSRVIVQSAVSLFVELPLDYQPKIANVPGVEIVSKFQWFGGFYKEQKNFFAQFGVDHEVFFDQYSRDLEIIEGPKAFAPTGPEENGGARAAVIKALSADRRAGIIGDSLAREFGWKVGDTVPLISPLFRRTDGGTWEFNVVGIYRPLKSNVDDRTLFFRYDYLQETIEAQGAEGPSGVGTYAVNVARGVDPAQVIAGIDGLFVNGPQKTRTSTEAAFQAAFVSMLGNLPLFIGTIGGAVVFAVFFSLVNTMLMAARQRVHEMGILKALGFADGVLARLLLGESLLLSMLGGGLGVALAFGSQAGIKQAVGKAIPTFAVEPKTAALGLAVALGIGIVAGIAPAIAALRLRPTEALRSEG